LLHSLLITRMPNTHSLEHCSPQAQPYEPQHRLLSDSFSFSPTNKSAHTYALIMTPKKRDKTKTTQHVLSMCPLPPCVYDFVFLLIFSTKRGDGCPSSAKLSRTHSTYRDGHTSLSAEYVRLSCEQISETYDQCSGFMPTDVCEDLRQSLQRHHRVLQDIEHKITILERIQMNYYAGLIDES
jgi:hypothetical protein